MKTTKTPKARRRTAAHVLPLGLQITARLLEPDSDTAYIKQNLADADQRAMRLLTDPMVTMKDDGAAFEVDAIANTLGAKKAADRIAAAIPASATHDPHGWIMDAIVPRQMAAMYLYLCIGYRIGRMCGGQDGAR